ncbi:MAG TPA: capsid cement protein [Candidatus Limnocylindria bacterium]|jgi:hypothetical protein|nr:capsid cement protein [Candidatus Limnocylindria bacterium]
MATSKGEVDLLTVSESADADLSTHKYKLVKQSATGVALCTTLNERAYGVLTNKPSAAGRTAQVQVVGVAKAMAGAAIAKGDFVKVDATARLITQTGEAAGVQVFVFGQALEAAGAAGDLISVLIRPLVVNLAVS